MDPRDARTSDQDRALGYLFLRATLGMNIFLHGLSRILSGTDKFVATLVQQFHATPLPAGVVSAFAHVLPWAEATIGLLLVLGAATRFALCAGAFLILLLTFGSALVQDWNAAGIQLTYALVYAALLAFREWNLFSVDGLLRRNGASG
jgi:thiosulfate dehydrogenase [quinone] large subunit